MIIVGIDPGADGAIVALDGDRASAWRMPTQDQRGRRRLDARAIVAILRPLHEGGVRVVVEAPSVRPGEGAQGALGVGLMHGGIRGVLDALGVPWRDVHPQTWRAGVGLPKEQDRKQRKHDAILLCERLLPGLELVYPGCRKPHDGTADAALMAVWGRSQAW
jgi:hypothetical protein